MNKPVQLNLLRLRFPVTAVVSILHRMSGVLLFLCMPYWLWVFSQCTAGPLSFASFQAYAGKLLPSLIHWFMLTVLVYHLLAGIRHLVMDSGFGESLACARRSAYLLLVLTALVSIVLGVWLW